MIYWNNSTVQKNEVLQLVLSIEKEFFIGKRLFLSLYIIAIIKSLYLLMVLIFLYFIVYE